MTICVVYDNLHIERPSPTYTNLNRLAAQVGFFVVQNHVDQ